MEILANGDKPCREVPISKLSSKIVIESRDYKPILAELAEDREKKISQLENTDIDYILRVVDAKKIQDIRKRAVVAMLAVGITPEGVSGLLNLSTRHIRRIKVKRADEPWR